jgi:hypothetical protein
VKVDNDTVEFDKEKENLKVVELLSKIERPIDSKTKVHIL